MEKKKIGLIASDMDHTLLTSKGEFPPDFYQMLAALGKAGITFVAASGRPMITLRRMFAKVADQMAFVSDNGAAVQLGGELVFSSFVDQTDYRRIISYSRREIGIDYVPILMCLEGCYIDAKDEKHTGHLQEFLTEITLVEDLLDLDVEPTKVTIYCPQQDSSMVLDERVAPDYLSDYTVVRGGDYWVDFTNKDIDKGVGLVALGDYLGLTPAQMMAFGDTGNDLEMLRTVKYSYAVANADADIKAVAAYETASNDEYGVSQVVWELLGH